MAFYSRCLRVVVWGYVRFGAARQKVLQQGLTPLLSSIHPVGGDGATGSAAPNEADMG